MDKPLSVLMLVNLHKDSAGSLMKDIAMQLEARGHRVVCHSFEGKPEREIDPGHFDLAFSLGGDGTVLYAARSLAPRNIPIIPVNLGTLGFIASVGRDEWEPIFSRWISRDCPVSSRMMLEVRVLRAGNMSGPWTALNDVVVSSSGISKIIRLAVGSDTVSFGNYRSDGLICATPTGSTAYSVAAGGPILDPEMQALIINPICPFTLSNRPLVIPAEEALHIDIEYEQRSAVLMTLDGQEVVGLEEGDRILVCRSVHQARLVESDRFAFYTALRSKLNWSGGPDA